MFKVNHEERRRKKGKINDVIDINFLCVVKFLKKGPLWPRYSFLFEQSTVNLPGKAIVCYERLYFSVTLKSNFGLLRLLCTHFRPKTG